MILSPRRGGFRLAGSIDSWEDHLMGCCVPDGTDVMIRRIGK